MNSEKPRERCLLSVSHFLWRDGSVFSPWAEASRPFTPKIITLSSLDYIGYYTLDQFVFLKIFFWSFLIRISVNKLTVVWEDPPEVDKNRIMVLSSLLSCVVGFQYFFFNKKNIAAQGPDIFRDNSGFLSWVWYDAYFPVSKLGSS